MIYFSMLTIMQVLLVSMQNQKIRASLINIYDMKD